MLFQRSAELAKELGIGNGGRLLLLHRGREAKRDGSLLLVGLSFMSISYPITVAIQTPNETHSMQLHMIGGKNRLHFNGHSLPVEQMGDYPERYLQTLQQVNTHNFRIVGNNEFQFEF